MTAMALAFIAAFSAGACAFLLTRIVQERIAHLRARMRPVTLDELLRDRTLCFASFAAVAVLASWTVSLWLLPGLLALAYVLSGRAPGFMDARKRRELRSACDGQLDVLADIVAMGVRAGLAFDAALGLYCEKFDNELSHEMNTALLSWKSGLATREQALSGLAAKLDSRALKRFAGTVVQALQYGSPLAGMLVEFAGDLREERKESIERQVEKAPVKMLIPMGTCILPAMLILVMGPVILQFTGTEM